MAAKIPHTDSDQRMTCGVENMIAPFSGLSRYSKAGMMPQSPAVYGMPPIEAATVIVKTFSIGPKVVVVDVHFANSFMVAYPNSVDGSGMELFCPA